MYLGTTGDDDAFGIYSEFDEVDSRLKQGFFQML